MGIAGGPRVLLLAFAARRALAGGRRRRPRKGRESIMNASFKRPAVADLHALSALVADSAILCGPARGPQLLFSNWEKERKSADVDALILAWIASHVSG